MNDYGRTGQEAPPRLTPDEYERLLKAADEYVETALRQVHATNGSGMRKEHKEAERAYGEATRARQALKKRKP